jgi:hypothetical protein
MNRFGDAVADGWQAWVFASSERLPSFPRPPFVFFLTVCVRAREGGEGARNKAQPSSAVARSVFVVLRWGSLRRGSSRRARTSRLRLEHR